MNYKFVRNSVVVGLLAIGVGLWGGNVEGLRATGVNTSSGTEQTGSIPASFETDGFNNPTFIDNVGLNYGINYYLQPLVQETLYFTVTDLDGFDGLTVEVRFFFDVDHSTNLDPVTKIVAGIEETEYQGDIDLDQAYNDAATTGTNGEAFSLKEKSGSNGNDYFEVVYTNGVTAADVTWQLGLTGYQQGDSIYERDFSVTFTPSKVARFTYDNAWTIGIRVLDTNNGNAIVAEHFDTSIDMEWYGEIVVPDNLQLSFTGQGANGEINVTDGYEDNTEVIQNILFISNGSFDQLIGADATWNSDKADPNGGNYYGYLATGASDLSFAQYFHLVVDDAAITDFSNVGSLTTVGSDIFNGYANTEVATHNATSESGVPLTYYLYLKTSTNFQNAVYTGSIYLGIQNTVAV